MMRGLVNPSSSDEQLLPSTPTSSTLFTFGHSFTFPYTMPVFSEALLAFLNGGDVTDEDITSVLEEYAWSCISGGKRVREYCGDLADVIAKLNKPSAVQRLLYTGPLATLFPFIRLTTTYLPSPPAFPAPLIPANNLPNVTRKQLIDSLSKLSSSAQQSLYTEGLIYELLVEYIGRRWRSGEGDVVEHVAKKLTEVEFEIQVQGDLATMRSMVQPALHRVRFLLGFLSSTQLVTRLNALFGASLPNSDRIRPDPERLIKAYIVRRLAAGTDPTLIVLDLTSAQDKLNSATHKSILLTSIASFGLHAEIPTPTEFGNRSTDTLLGPTSPTVSFGPTISPRRATFSKLASKFSYKRHAAPTQNWLSHRKNSLSVSRLHLPDFNTDRRPSLPTLPCSRSSPPFKPVKSPLAMASMTSIQTIRPIREEQSRVDLADGSADCPLAIELVHRILDLRFRVTKNGGWFLGTGRESARMLLRSAQDDTDGQRLVHDICALFGIILYPAPPQIPRPVTPASYGVTGEPRTPSPTNWLPAAPSLVPLSLGYEGKHPFAKGEDPISPLSIASFDLDEYYARMSSARSAKSSHKPKLSSGTMTTDFSPMGPGYGEVVLIDDPYPREARTELDEYYARAGTDKSTHAAKPSTGTMRTECDVAPNPTLAEARNRRRISTGLESVFTSHTHLTGLTHGRTSRLSSYSIREATKEWPSTAVATTFSMIPVPTVTLGGVTLPENDDDSPRPTHRHSRSRSETDLLAVIKRDSALSPLPPRPTSLRRTRTINPRSSINLSAWDLGLDHVTPLGPISPATPSRFGISTSTRWAQHAFASSDRGCPPHSPPLSPTSSFHATPRAGAFPLPPKDLPSPVSSSTAEKLDVTPRVRSNRKYTIIHGEVSPSRCGDHKDESDYFAGCSDTANQAFPVPVPTGSSASRPSMTTRRSQEKSLPVPPRTSSLSSRGSGETARGVAVAETPLSLALSLFTSIRQDSSTQPGGCGHEALVPRPDLTVQDVDTVLDTMVECEKARIRSRGKQWDDAARCRIGWLMDQLGDMLHDPRFAPIIDVHLDRLAPASLKTGMLNTPSPRSSPGSFHSSTSTRLYPSSPLTALNGHSSLSLPIPGRDEDTPPIPQSSPRPPPRKLVLPNEVTSQPVYPMMVPLSPTEKTSARPLPRTPKTRHSSSNCSMDSSLTSKLSIGTFGH